MSSSYVRTQISTFFGTKFPTESLVDMTVEYNELQRFMSQHGLSYTSDWVGLQFIGADEIPVSVGSDNTKGCYRETGSLFFHIVTPAKDAAADNIVARSEVLRDGFRGQRINDIVIESVSPLSTESSATLQFNGGFTSGSYIVNYYRDINL